MSSESGRFSFRQECEVSMWLLADGPVHFLTGCELFGEMDSVFFLLGKSKPLMLYAGKN